MLYGINDVNRNIMKHLILSIVLIIPCINSYSQNTINLPQNTHAYLVLNDKTTAVDSLMVREYRDKETKHLIKRMDRASDEDKDIFPWEDVAASVKEQQTTPIIINHKCDKCWNNTVIVYFVSPAWTWEKLCGRAGYLIICPHCVRQIEFFCSYMN